MVDDTRFHSTTEREWRGFCEIESEPALFDTLLKDFGVRGVRIREIISLDDDLLDLLPRPVYGLVFLYRWADGDTDRQEQSCPPGIWFANQTIKNACASVALLNIVNNVPDLELGPNLHAFKDFSQHLSPADRGDAVANFDYIMSIHNSFARKLDMLNADLAFKNHAQSKTHPLSAAPTDLYDDAAFHFVAFMPIGKCIWKLDGLERQPLCIGDVVDGCDWLCQVKPEIEARMCRYAEDQIEIVLLSLVKDPLLSLMPRMITINRCLDANAALLNGLKPDWRNDLAPTVIALEGSADDLIASVCLRYALDDLIPSTPPADPDVSADVRQLLQMRERLLQERGHLKTDVREELESIEADEAKAASRKRDFGTKMQQYARLIEVKRRA